MTEGQKIIRAKAGLVELANQLGNPERHEYELYLAVGGFDHSRTKCKGPQTTASWNLSINRRSTSSVAWRSAGGLSLLV